MLSALGTKNSDNWRSYFVEDKNNQRSGPVRKEWSDQICSRSANTSKVAANRNELICSLKWQCTEQELKSSNCSEEDLISALGKAFFPMVKITMGRFAWGSLWNFPYGRLLQTELANSVRNGKDTLPGVRGWAPETIAILMSAQSIPELRDGKHHYPEQRLGVPPVCGWGQEEGQCWLKGKRTFAFKIPDGWYFSGSRW